MSRMTPVLRRSLLVLGAIVLLLLATAVAGFAALQTNSGRAWAAAALSRALSSPDMRVSVAGLTGSVPSRMHVARISVADRDGVWLDISDATLELRLGDLLGRQLTIERIAAVGVTVSRAPRSETPSPPAPSKNTSDLLALPRLPVNVAVDSAAIERLSLGPDLVGQAVTATLTAQGRLTKEDAAAQLAVHRVDGTAGHARVDFRLDADQTLAMHLDVAEPTGSLLQNLTGKPEPLPLAISIEGDGPLDGWQGAIHATAGDDAHVDAAITLAAGDRPRLTAEGAVAVQSLLPPQIRAVLPQPVNFATSVMLVAETVVLERLWLDDDTLRLSASGSLDRRSQTFTGQADASVSELQALDPLTGAGLTGRASAKLTAEGTLDAPRVDVTLNAENLGGPVRAERATAKLLAARKDSAWTVRGSGDAAGIVWPVAQPGLPDALEWTLDATADDAFSQATLQDFTLRARGLEVAAKGRADALSPVPRGRATIDVKAADLSAWQEAAGQALAGRLSLSADVTAAGDGVTAALKGKGEELATGTPALDALLGARLDLRGTIRRTADGALSAHDIEIAGAHVTLSGDATSDAAFSALDARVKLDAPRLAVLSDALGNPMQGAARVDAHVTGSLDHPAAEIDAATQDLRIGARRVDRATVKASLSDALAPRGTLTAALKSAALDANLDAAFARTGPETFELSKLALRAPGSELNGALKINTAEPGASGTMTLRATDLAPWSALAGTALAGAADARIALSEKDGQRADIDASVRNLRLAAAQASVERVKIEARLADLLRKPGGRASVEASAVALPDLRIDRLRANAQSAKAGSYTVSVDTDGVLRPGNGPQPLRLTTAGEITIADAEQRLRVTQLKGRVGDHDIVSHAPLTVSVASNRFKMDGLDLGLDKGRVTGSAMRDGTRIALQAQLRDLPLALAQLAVPQEKVTGTLNGTIRLSGTTAQPDGQIDLSLREVRAAAAANLPPLSLNSRGTWKGERFDVEGDVSVPDGTKLDVRGTLPLKLDTATLMPTVIPNGALRATVKGDGRLERWAALLPLGEDRVAGQYAIDLAIDGTPAAPRPHGKVAISEGSYVNFAMGTTIGDLAAEVTGDGRNFVLTRLSGSDGAGGTIEGRGSLDLGTTTAFDATIRFTNFILARRDDMTGNGDGELRFAGTAEASKLSGRVHIDRAELRIPEKLPSSVPDLPVIMVDRNSGEVISNPEQTASASTTALDLAVDIPGQTFVRGRGLDSEWRGAMQITGTTSAPQLRGKLETVRGDFSLLGKRFTLADSAITFLGGEKIDPQLAITAEHRASTIVAQALITGSASDPSIKLTSQPEMPQDEVLARVLFGRSAGEMTPAQGLELAQAAAALAGKGGPGILDRVRAATGLDRLDISSREPGSTGSGSNAAATTAVTAGKYVSDRVFLGVEQGATQESTRSKVEVEVTPNVTVQSTVGNSGAGVGVNWKWDY